MSSYWDEDRMFKGEVSIVEEIGVLTRRMVVVVIFPKIIVEIFACGFG